MSVAAADCGGRWYVCMTGTPVMVMVMVMLTPKTTPGMVIIPVPLSKVPVPPNVPEPLRVGVIFVLIMPVTPVSVKVEVDVTGGKSVIVTSDPEKCPFTGLVLQPHFVRGWLRCRDIVPIWDRLNE
jgi:hypothetical protein